MNDRIKELKQQAADYVDSVDDGFGIEHYRELVDQKFAELIVEATLTQVAERAYYTGDRDWSDELDRPWIQLEFGYGPLADAKKGIFK